MAGNIVAKHRPSAQFPSSLVDVISGTRSGAAVAPSPLVPTGGRHGSMRFVRGGLDGPAIDGAPVAGRRDGPARDARVGARVIEYRCGPVQSSRPPEQPGRTPVSLVIVQGSMESLPVPKQSRQRAPTVKEPAKAPIAVRSADSGRFVRIVTDRDTRPLARRSDEERRTPPSRRRIAVPARAAPAGGGRLEVCQHPNPGIRSIALAAREAFVVATAGGWMPQRMVRLIARDRQPARRAQYASRLTPPRQAQ